MYVAIQKFDSIKIKPCESDFNEIVSNIMIELTTFGKEYKKKEVTLKA